MRFRNMEVQESEIRVYVVVFKQRSKCQPPKASSSCTDLSWRSMPLKIQRLLIENFELQKFLLDFIYQI